MLAERGLLTLSKDGKIDPDTKDTIDEAGKKGKAGGRAESMAIPHIPLPGHSGPLTKTQERHMKAKQNIAE